MLSTTFDCGPTTPDRHVEKLRSPAPEKMVTVLVYCCALSNCDGSIEMLTWAGALAETVPVMAGKLDPGRVGAQFVSELSRGLGGQAKRLGSRCGVAVNREVQTGAVRLHRRRRQILQVVLQVLVGVGEPAIADTLGLIWHAEISGENGP